MRKMAVMFPGQGSQFKGMGKGLFAKYKNDVGVASNILGYDLEEMCLFDPNRNLDKTEFTQPALFVVNALMFREMKSGNHPEFLIGHSLGEYNALHAAGAFDFETGLRLVQKRGELMAASDPGAMAAVLGLTADELDEVLQKGGYDCIDVANFNTPSQIVISGDRQSVDILLQDFERRGIKSVPLAVSAAFHSRYMISAALEFSEFVKDFQFFEPKIQVISNVNARPHTRSEMPSLLASQISSSVRWVDTIHYLMDQGCQDFEQAGGGYMLTNMVKEIRAQRETFNGEKAGLSSVNGSAKSPVQSKQEVEGGGLGSSEFRVDYNVNYCYVVGGMSNGISSKKMVIKLAKAGILGYLGTSNVSFQEIENDIRAIRSILQSGEPFGVNLTWQRNDTGREIALVEMFLKHRVKNLEVAGYFQITLALVYYHVKGLRLDLDGSVIAGNRIMAKVSRPEMAEAFVSPPPPALLQELLDKRLISGEQAQLAIRLPMSFDICVASDSGGHTDRGGAMALFPAICSIVKAKEAASKFSRPIRVGLSGGLGVPASVVCAFVMGADFVMTGSINQCTVEAETSDIAKDLLQTMNVQDTDFAPSFEFFESGAKVQVLKKATLFPSRGNKLYELFLQFGSMDEIPSEVIRQLELYWFKMSVSEAWERIFKSDNHQLLSRDASLEPIGAREKMTLVFRWFLQNSMNDAINGNQANKTNFQIYTGPAMGAFNQWVKGTHLESWRNREVDKIAVIMMTEAERLMKKLQFRWVPQGSSN